ncbi:MAG TPA: hypothetical protein VGX45_02620, partial [Solirubrobacteraceae bacterium]|nr:hypothetical protein [Solirubrobacteraceae bacterium]
MRRRMLAAVVAVAGLGVGAAPAGALTGWPNADISSSFGSGDFGSWVTDPFGLESYRYTVDELRDPIARQPELAGSTDGWTQVGNDHIVADAFNHGYVQLWSQDRLYQWMNYYDASQRHYAGGFGYLKLGRRVISTLYDDRPSGARTQRRFGVGYYAKSLRVRGVSERDVVYAPFGDDPVLLHDVTITNTS